MIRGKKLEGETGARRKFLAMSGAFITNVSSEINVKPPVRQISRVQTGLFRRAGAPTGSD